MPRPYVSEPAGVLLYLMKYRMAVLMVLWVVEKGGGGGVVTEGPLYINHFTGHTF